jgi:hypothetical protein
LRRLDIEVAGMQQFEQQVLHILADVTRLGQGSGIADGERYIENARQRARQQRFAAAGWTDQQNVAFVHLDVGVALVAQAEALVVVMNGDAQELLGALLTDDVLVELVLDRSR